jgi:hypothetical protein
MAKFKFTYELRAADRLIAEIDGQAEILDGDIYVEFETIPSSGGYVPVPSWMEGDVVSFLQCDPVYRERLADARMEDRHEVTSRDRRIARSDTTAASMMSLEPVFAAIFRSAAE